MPENHPRTVDRARRRVVTGALALSLAFAGAVSAAGSAIAGSAPATGTSAVGDFAERPVDDVLAQGGYQQVWADEFDSTALDGTQWSPVFRSKAGDFIHPNDNFGYFADQVSVGGGTLHIDTTAASGTVDGRTVSFRSGSASTAGHRTFTYGYLEARIRYSAIASGYGPAMWLDGVGDADNRRYHDPDLPKAALAPGGAQEVDVLEAYPGYSDFVVHRTDGEVRAESRLGYFSYAQTAKAGEWHTYGLMWKPGGYELYFDGQLAGTLNGTATDPVSNTPMYLMLSAAGHTAPGGKATMDVDWVHYYQTSADDTARAAMPQWTQVDRGPWLTRASSTDGTQYAARTVKVHGVGASHYWRSADSQSGDEWFMVDTGKVQDLGQLRVVAPQAVTTGGTGSSDATGAPATSYEVYATDDPAGWSDASSPSWGTPLASGAGSPTIDACLPQGTQGRYLMIRQTGINAAKKWSVRDVYAFNSAPLTGVSCF
ncbi:family 16 glycosylhydrolase [Streptomyces sp. NPDC051940]|uniref:family 16 glycosylhydrolase n=1 Tax=Streptomyces sp. NPDC051940 TaxID=3155675 RepID=UPI003428C83B